VRPAATAVLIGVATAVIVYVLEAQVFDIAVPALGAVLIGLIVATTYFGQTKQ
jgi:hypothetical protein